MTVARSIILATAIIFAAHGADAPRGVGCALEVNAAAGQGAMRVMAGNHGSILELGPDNSDRISFRVGDLQDDYGGGVFTVGPVGITVEKDATHYGDVVFPTSNYGLVMTSPNGHRWRVAVADSGRLYTTPLN